MKKKQVCTGLAVLVSVCFLVSLISTGIAMLGAVQSGAAAPMGMVMLILVTGFCTVMIWRGIREME